MKKLRIPQKKYGINRFHTWIGKELKTPKNKHSLPQMKNLYFAHQAKWYWLYCAKMNDRDLETILIQEGRSFINHVWNTRTYIICVSPCMVEV